MRQEIAQLIKCILRSVYIVCPCLDLVCCEFILNEK